METLEAWKASQQDFFVADALFGPTFQNLRNAESFDSMKTCHLPDQYRG
jgi:hypothetical protein